MGRIRVGLRLHSSAMQGDPMQRTLTLREAYQQFYLSECVDLGAGTRSRYHFELLRWERHTTNPDVRQITKATANEFRQHCLDLGYSRSSIESTLSVVRRILRITAEADDSPLTSIPILGRSLKQPQPNPRALTLEQMADLYRVAHVTTWPKFPGLSPAVFWRCFDVVAFCTGLRLYDLMRSLNWRDVTDSTLTCQAKKTGKLHRFPMHPVLARHLEVLKPLQSIDGRILPLSRSPHLVRRELRLRSNAACITPAITPKHLRQNAGTHWESAEGGAGGKVLGHSLGVSDRYISIPRVLQTAVGKLRIPACWNNGPHDPYPQDGSTDDMPATIPFHRFAS